MLFKRTKVEEKKVLSEPEANFRSWRRKLLKMSLISILLTFVSILIVGSKVFYPFHVVVGVGIYIVSFIELVRRIYASRKVWQKYRYYEFTQQFFKKEKRRLVIALVITISVIAFLWIHPVDANPFAGLSNTAVEQMVADDLHISIFAMDYLESSGNALLAELDRDEIGVIETKKIASSFEDFLKAVSFSEALTEKHKYFAAIPYRLWDERVTSFLISYSLYVKKYAIVHRIMATVSGNEQEKKILNQEVAFLGKSNVYNEMVTRFYHPKTALRLNLGYLYMRIFARPNTERNGEFALLNQKATDSHAYLRGKLFSTVVHTGEVLLDGSEKKMFDVWFPIQKTVASTMGNTVLTARGEEGFITTEQALAMGSAMEPGDIILQRRNWHLSNIGIPGFYSHAAIYTGSMETMDKYFASEFPYLGYTKFSDYVKDKYPNVYEAYSVKDSEGYTGEIIEAIEPGVVLQSLATSLNADFAAALRPNLSKKDKLLSLLITFEEFGKPYDFNFDFDTNDTLVCSELIFNSYVENLPQKRGLHFAISKMSGRRMVTPLAIAEKYIEEKGSAQPELSFAYFLKGNEKSQKSRVATEEEFVETVSWSKFSFMQQ